MPRIREIVKTKRASVRVLRNRIAQDLSLSREGGVRQRLAAAARPVGWRADGLR